MSGGGGELTHMEETEDACGEKGKYLQFHLIRSRDGSEPIICGFDAGSGLEGSNIFYVTFCSKIDLFLMFLKIQAKMRAFELEPRLEPFPNRQSQGNGNSLCLGFSFPFGDAVYWLHSFQLSIFS